MGELLQGKLGLKRFAKRAWIFRSGGSTEGVLILSYFEYDERRKGQV